MDEPQPITQSPDIPQNQSLPEEIINHNSGHSSKDSLLKQAKMDKKASIQSSKLNSICIERENVVLKEDVFGRYTDETGEEHLVYRYTWKNRNNIQVQVINYGARVTSIRLPDRKGEIEDIVLGFDDIAGYLFYDKHYFGATIGRYSNIIQNGSFILNKKSYTVTSNFGEHCFHGGHKGLDKVVWNTHIMEGKKVIMSYVSPNMSDGFPGDLLVRITFELSGKNEFKINMDAQSTCPTIVNMSNLLYFNLAGHHKGPDEIYKHMLTMNCNCFTPAGDNGIPTSEIINVIHTSFDFQIPKQVGKVIGIVPKDGFDVNLCVNRGMYQGQCFVGRMLHVPTGRMLEVYSNQPGVQLLTGNDFGHGQFKTMEEIMGKKSESKILKTVIHPVMLVYQKVHDKVLPLLQNDKLTNFEEIKNLLIKFNDMKKRETNSLTDFLTTGIELTSTQVEYLQKAKEIVCEDPESDDSCLDLKDALSNILKVVKVVESDIKVVVKEETRISQVSEQSQSKTKALVLNSESLENNRKSDVRESKLPVSEIMFKEGSLRASAQKKTQVHSRNKIPAIYKTSDVIRGKGGAVYKMHGGVALQTQNYPNAPHMKMFPSCELKPGEVYKHDVVYRFWIRAGNPTKWVRRNEATKKVN